jgi:hypothetical protein
LLSNQIAKKWFSGLSQNMWIIHFNGELAATNNMFLAAIEEISSGMPISAVSQWQETCCYKSQNRFLARKARKLSATNVRIFRYQFFAAGALWIEMSHIF